MTEHNMVDDEICPTCTSETRTVRRKVKTETEYPAYMCDDPWHTSPSSVAAGTVSQVDKSVYPLPSSVPAESGPEICPKCGKRNDHDPSFGTYCDCWLYSKRRRAAETTPSTEPKRNGGLQEQFERDRHVGPRSIDGYCLSSDQEALAEARAALKENKMSREIPRGATICKHGKEPYTCDICFPPPEAKPVEVWQHYRSRTDDDDQWVIVDKKEMDEAFALEFKKELDYHRERE